MQFWGIDVGTDSVRLCVLDDENDASFSERPLSRHSSASTHTMSGEHLWKQVWSLLEQGASKAAIASLKPKTHRRNVIEGDSPKEMEAGENSEAEEEVEGEVEAERQASAATSDSPSEAPSVDAVVGVAATCSMVVMRRVTVNGQQYFYPLERGHEITVWMDQRAQTEAQWLSSKLPQAALAQIGGSVTPEMGLAKLKWADTHYGADSHHGEVCVFELYDWVSYLIMAQGYRADGSVRCLDNDIAHFDAGSTAMDGSVKGWGEDILRRLQISAKVCGLPPQLTESRFPRVGTPMAQVGSVVVAHGCIDCYAGWAPLAGEEGCSLMMVSGTSTCFIAQVPTEKNKNKTSEKGTHGKDNSMEINKKRLDKKKGDNEPVEEDLGEMGSAIDGLWGPFSQLVRTPIYSFGQPATGQLLAELFEEFSDFIGENDPFEFVEECAAELEITTSLPVLARHHLYSPESHGNRSPYGEFRMGPAQIDGRNASSISLAEHSPRALALKYYLTLEFLVLQTHQLCQRLPSIDNVYISGSQARNQRFLSMLAMLPFRESRVFVREDNAKFAGCQGIALAGQIAANGAVSAPGAQANWKLYEPTWKLESPDSRVLAAKYKHFEKLAKLQYEFHREMAGVDQAHTM